MRQMILRSLLGLTAVAMPAWLMAQTPAPAADATVPAATADAAAPAKAAGEVQFYQLTYEPGTKVNLPIQTCEIRTEVVARPHTVKLPVKARISTYDIQTLTPGATVFDGLITEPKKLDMGYYSIQVEGEKEPIYVAYATPETWQMYLIRRAPAMDMMGPFVLPGTARLPIGQYSLQGSRFQMMVECRNEERALFNVPTFDSLPPFLAPAEGISW